MLESRVTLFAGHYGSGKTNLAVNYARRLARDGREVTLADLDIVNPYFRAKDSEELLRREGVRLISSPYANSNVDIPALPQEMYAVIDDRSRYAVLDIGGDDRGALALGRTDTGRIAPGYRADLILVDFGAANLVPCHDIAENLVFAAHGSNVVMNMARGRIIYENGAFLTLDLERIRAEVTGYALPLIFGAGK